MGSNLLHVEYSRKPQNWNQLFSAPHNFHSPKFRKGPTFWITLKRRPKRSGRGKNLFAPLDFKHCKLSNSKSSRKCRPEIFFIKMVEKFSAHNFRIKAQSISELTLGWVSPESQLKTRLQTSFLVNRIPALDCWFKIGWIIFLTV